MATIRRYRVGLLFLGVFIILGIHVLAAPDQYFEWSLIYISNGMISRGVDNLKKSVVVSPGDLEAQVLLAMAYSAQGNHAKAIPEYR